MKKRMINTIFKKVIKEMTESWMFVKHIEKHLDENQQVMCKICNKTKEQIVREWRNSQDD